VTEIRRVAAEIALAVGIQAQRDGVAPRCTGKGETRSGLTKLARELLGGSHRSVSHVTRSQ
jgi:hypothetical protein